MIEIIVEIKCREYRTQYILINFNGIKSKFCDFEEENMKNVNSYTVLNDILNDFEI